MADAYLSGLSLGHSRVRWRSWSLATIASASLCIAAVLQIAALVALPVDGYDAPYHLYWVRSWHELWQSGIFYPRWLPDSANGFGAPTFYFYPPLTYELSSILYVVMPALSVEAMTKILIALTLAGSGITMWMYLRSHVAGSAIWFGVLLYVFAPYRFLDWNTRTALSEHVAFVFLPLVFLSMERICQERSLRWICALGFSLAAMLLTSLPAAACVGVLLLVYVLHARSGIVLRRVLIAVIVAGCASSFFLLQILANRGYVQLEHIWDSIGAGSPIAMLLSGQDLRISLYTTLTFVGICVIAYSYWRRQRNDGEHSAEVWLLLIVAVLQLPYLPSNLFDHILPFRIIQQPYRLSMLALPVIARLWAQHVHGRERRQSIAGVVAVWSIATTLLVGLQVVGFHLHEHTTIAPPHELPTKWMANCRNPEDRMLAGFGSMATAIIQNGELISASRSALSDSADYFASAPGTITFRRTYWPTWDAYIDGQRAATYADDVGRLAIRVPAGRHWVSLNFDP